MTINLSIVILHHGSPKEVTANLQALSTAWLPKKTEVLVINNGPTGANEQILVEPNLKFDLRFFEIKNQGYPQGNNFGLQIAQGRTLCILNPDVQVKKTTFQVLMKYLEAHPKVGLVAPRLRYPSGKVQDNYRVFPRPFDLFMKRTVLRKIFFKRMHRYLMWDKDVTKSEPVDWLTGAFHVFTHRCWTKIGPNDDRYFLFMSDVDLCRTAWQCGFEVHFVGTAEARHGESRLSSGGLLDIFKKPVLRIHVWDALKYYWKWKFKKVPSRRS